MKKIFSLIEIVIVVFILSIFSVLMYTILKKYITFYPIYKELKLTSIDLNKFIDYIAYENLNGWKLFTGKQNYIILQKFDKIYSGYFYKKISCFNTGINISNISTGYNTNFTNITTYPNINCINLNYNISTGGNFLNIYTKINKQNKSFHLFLRQ